MRHRSLLACIILTLLAIASNAAEIHYVDLQQEGSSAIVIQGRGKQRKVILVDTGKSSSDVTRGGGRVLKKLDELKIRHIDLAIFSHIDADHFGGYKNLLGLSYTKPQPDADEVAPARGPPPVTIARVLEPGIPVDKTSYETLLDDLDTCDIEHVTVGDPKALAALERDFGIKIFAPQNARNTNSSSLLVRIDDAKTNTSQLLTGDTTPAAWRQIAPHFPTRHITTITAPHHGGDRVLLAIVDKTQPQHVIFQADAHNRYGHPRLALLRDLARRGHHVDLRYVERTKELLANEHSAVQRYLLLGNIASNDPIHERLREREADFTRRVAEAQDVVRATRPAFLYRDILITGEQGDITITPKRVRAREQSPYEAFLTEAVWYRARYLTDADISALGTWRSAQDFLRLQVTDDLRALADALKPRSLPVDPLLFKPRPRMPAWSAEYERILYQLHGRDANVAKLLYEYASRPLPKRTAAPPAQRYYERESRRSAQAEATRQRRIDAAIDKVERELGMQIAMVLNWRARQRIGRGSEPQVHFPQLDLSGVPEFAQLDHDTPRTGIEPSLRKVGQRSFYLYDPLRPRGFDGAETRTGERVEREHERARWRVEHPTFMHR